MNKKGYVIHKKSSIMWHDMLDYKSTPYLMIQIIRKFTIPFIQNMINNMF